MDLLGTRQVDPIHQSPRTRAYGFFAKGTVPTSHILTHLVSFLFLTIFAGCLPRPTSVAGCPVTRLSPRFIGTIQPADYSQSVARHFATAYRSAYSGATGDSASSPDVTRCSSVPCRPQTPWYGGGMRTPSP